MKKPKVCVLSGYGINCDDGTKFAFEQAGAEADIIHINDIIEGDKKLADYQVLAFPGGFSMGDDMGAGKGYAAKIRNNLQDAILEFVERDRLVIGICNGFQIMTLLGLAPAFDGYGTCNVALTHNLNAAKPQANARYETRWIDLKGASDKCVWTKGIDHTRLPIAHGEGRFFAQDDVLEALAKEDQIVFQYVRPDGSPTEDEFPFNPNGSAMDIAAICDTSGRILGMMPHPERAISFTQGPTWTLEKRLLKKAGRPMPEERDGIKIFRNGVAYFS